MARGPQGERGIQGAEGPEGPRGPLLPGLMVALALMLMGGGLVIGLIISGISAKDERPDQTNRFGEPPAFAGEWGAPGSPQRIQDNPRYAHYDVQLHNRDNPVTMDAPMQAQHGPDCSGPPNTHAISSMEVTVFVCNDHLMTSLNSHGYGEIMLTPSQVLNCSAGCTVQFELSTERMSGRDWPDLWLSPWDDNLALPLAPWYPDLQGFPRRGLHITSEPGANSWLLRTINNYSHTDLNTAWWAGMHEGIAAGTNQSATRQKFQLTVQAGGVKFERLASATASAFVWTLDANGNPGFAQCACLLASDYVVQFGHHSYTPEKDGAGIPGTWHWQNFTLSPSVPFTLIHATPRVVTANNSTVTFGSPAPANAFLRFSGVCKVTTDAAQAGTMALAPRQAFLRAGLSASFFVPIQQGRTSVKIAFQADDWFSGPCHAQDFHVWSKGGVVPGPTPTPFVPLPMTPTPPPTVVLPPTVTPTPVGPPPPTPIGPPSPTPVAPTVTPMPTVTSKPCRVQIDNSTNPGMQWAYNTALGSYTGVLVNGKCV